MITLNHTIGQGNILAFSLKQCSGLGSFQANFHRKHDCIDHAGACQLPLLHIPGHPATCWSVGCPAGTAACLLGGSLRPRAGLTSRAACCQSAVDCGDWGIPRVARCPGHPPCCAAYAQLTPLMSTTLGWFWVSFKPSAGSVHGKRGHEWA